MALIRGRDSGAYAPTPLRTPTAAPAPSYSPTYFDPGPSYTMDDLFTPGYFEQPRPAPLGMSLGRLGLSLAPASQWTSMTPEPEYVPAEYASPGPSQPSSGTVSRTGGLGLGAYGFSGRSGLAEHKGSSPYGLQTQMWSALNRAQAALKAAGLGQFGITDGWRSYESQVALKKKKPTLAATAGRSVHGLGLAADLRLTNAQYQWLLKNGAQYNLVNLPSENWHWQYNPAAWKGSF